MRSENTGFKPKKDAAPSPPAAPEPPPRATPGRSPKGNSAGLDDLFAGGGDRVRLTKKPPGSGT